MEHNITNIFLSHPRLNTILDYDRILVLDKGEIAEFGTVSELKQNPKGIFHKPTESGKLLVLDWLITNHVT